MNEALEKNVTFYAKIENFNHLFDGSLRMDVFPLCSM